MLFVQCFGNLFGVNGFKGHTARDNVSDSERYSRLACRATREKEESEVWLDFDVGDDAKLIHPSPSM